MPQQRLQHFKSEIYGRVEGWLGDRMWQIVDVIGTIFETNGLRGNITGSECTMVYFYFIECSEK